MNDGLKKLKMRLPAVFLVAATLLFWGFYDRYELAGPILLNSPSLADGSSVRGDCTETNGHFILRVPESGKTASMNFRIPNSTDYEQIRVRARIKVEDVVEGKFSWRCARLLLTQYDQANKWIPGKHGLVSERDSKDWEFHEDVFELDPTAEHSDVVIQQAGVFGTAEFDGIVAEPVRLRASFVWWRIIVSSFWIFMGLVYFKRCRLDRRKLRVLILLNALAIITGALMPGEWIEDTTEWLKTTAKETIQKPVEPLDSFQSLEKSPEIIAQDTARIDQFNEMMGGAHQAGHFALFASLCFLVYCSAALERQHPVYYAKVAFDILLFSAVTETLQHLTIDRTAGVSDWLTDVYGMFAALLIFAAVRLLSKLIGRRAGFLI
jgi:hypothetical protein